MSEQNLDLQRLGDDLTLGLQAIFQNRHAKLWLTHFVSSYMHPGEVCEADAGIEALSGAESLRQALADLQMEVQNRIPQAGLRAGFLLDLYERDYLRTYLKPAEGEHERSRDADDD